MTTQTGFLLSYIKYGDNDAILNCFTQESGFASFFIKGLYASKNKKKAYLFPLNELYLTLSPRKNNRDIFSVSKIELSKNFVSNNNVKGASILFFIADFLKDILKEEEANPVIYSEINKLMVEIDNSNHSSHLIFLVQYLKISGLLPLMNVAEYLNPKNGNFERFPSNHIFDIEISEIWKKIIVSKNPYSEKIPPNQKKRFLDSLFEYYRHHIPDFRNPPSLEIVQQIFI